GRVVALGGGPDPFMDVVRMEMGPWKRAWNRSPREFGGRATFEVATWGISWLKLGKAAELLRGAAEVARVGKAVTEVADAARVADDAVRAVEFAASTARTSAGMAARAAGAEAMLKQATKAGAANLPRLAKWHAEATEAAADAARAAERAEEA